MVSLPWIGSRLIWAQGWVLFPPPLLSLCFFTLSPCLRFWCLPVPAWCLLLHSFSPLVVAGVRALERLGSSCLDPRDDTGGDGWGRWLSLTSPLFFFCWSLTSPWSASFLDHLALIVNISALLDFSWITKIYTNTQMQKHICKKYTKSKTQKMTPSITAPLVDITDSPNQNSWTSGPFGSSWLG